MVEDRTKRQRKSLLSKPCVIIITLNQRSQNFCGGMEIRHRN